MRISDWSSDVCSSDLHKTKITTVAIAIQAVAGVFTAPVAPDDLIAVGSVTNGEDIIQAEDPTMTGSIWNSARIYLGKTANVGFTLPLRGPGGASPPAAGEWVPGRVFQAGGWAEVVTAAPITGTAQARSEEPTPELQSLMRN